MSKIALVLLIEDTSAGGALRVSRACRHAPRFTWKGMEKCNL